jgi:hypothetical protein
MRFALIVVCHSAGLRRWQSVSVEHCRDAWALVLEHMSGWSLVYSGDTRPCPSLAAAGHGCTLLIHEATFEPALMNQVCGAHGCLVPPPLLRPSMRYLLIPVHAFQPMPCNDCTAW